MLVNPYTTHRGFQRYCEGVTILPDKVQGFHSVTVNEDTINRSLDELANSIPPEFRVEVYDGIRFALVDCLEVQVYAFMHRGSKVTKYEDASGRTRKFRTSCVIKHGVIVTDRAGNVKYKKVFLPDNDKSITLIDDMADQLTNLEAQATEYAMNKLEANK